MAKFKAFRGLRVHFEPYPIVFTHDVYETDDKARIEALEKSKFTKRLDAEVAVEEPKADAKDAEVAVEEPKKTREDLEKEALGLGYTANEVKNAKKAELKQMIAEVKES